MLVDKVSEVLEEFEATDFLQMFHFIRLLTTTLSWKPPRVTSSYMVFATQHAKTMQWVSLNEMKLDNIFLFSSTLTKGDEL